MLDHTQSSEAFFDSADEFPHNFNSVPNVFQFSFSGISEIISEVEKADNFKIFFENLINFIEHNRANLDEEEANQLIAMIEDEINIFAFSNLAKSSVITI